MQFEATRNPFKSSLLHRAKTIPISDKFVAVFAYLIEEIFENRMYRQGKPEQRLSEIVSRDMTYAIYREDWEAEGIKFERSGDLPLDGFVVLFRTHPNKATKPGTPKPVIFSGGFKQIEEHPNLPALLFDLNGTLTKAEALDQFYPSSPEFPNIKMILKHELSHAYDRQQLQDMKSYTEEQLQDNAIYFNAPPEVRAWTGSLIDEFHEFLKGKDEIKNELIDAFLRGSRVWSLLNQHLNAANRRYVLHELSRDLEEQKGHNGRLQMGDRGAR